MSNVEGQQQIEAVAKPTPPMVVLRNFLTARTKELQTALPPHMSADRFIRVILTAVQQNHDLLACDRQTLWNAALRCASDGLIPDGREAALVPFKSRVTYIPMYGGLLKLFRNSGEFKHINAGIVYEGEEFAHWVDEHGEHFRHVPGEDRDEKKIRRVYATATTKNGGFFIADLSMSDINKRRNMSRATREDAPWKMWTQEMMQKTAIRVLSKRLPLSSDVDALIERDEAALLGVESVEDARVTLSERPSTQATLDHFGGDSPNPLLQTGPDFAPEPSEPDSEPGTDAERPPSDAADGEAAGAAAHNPTAPAAEQGLFVDPIVRAEQRGRADRASGQQRRAIPGEYRDKKALADAWLKGWDSGA